MMAGATLDQERQYFPTRITRRAPSSRPTDDIGLMQVARAVHVGAGVEQSARRFHVPVADGEVQRRSIIASIARIGVGARGEQKADGICMPMPGGSVQPRPAETVRFNQLREA